MNVPPHSRPGQPMTLTTPPKRAQPQPSDLATKGAQRRTVHRHAVVADVTADDATQPRVLLADGTVHASSQFGFHLPQLRLQPRADCLPQHVWVASPSPYDSFIHCTMPV